MAIATATFACPIGWCDVSPYDTADELGEHLANHPAPGQFAPAAPTPVVRADPSPAAPRSFSPGGTRSTVAQRPAVPPTDKQLSFLRSLLADHPEVDAPDLDALTKREASRLIDSLLKLPRPARPAVAPVPEGLHLFDGRVFKVQTSKAGNRYAKVLRISGTKGSWSYVGTAPLRDLSDSTVATLEVAQQFGLNTGVCMCCGRTLTNPESIARGIGPICASRF